MKVRAKIYELVAFVYMDDPFDNFIEATEGIVRRISFDPAACQKVLAIEKKRKTT